MKLNLTLFYCFQILSTTASSQLVLPFNWPLRSSTPSSQESLMDPVGPALPSVPKQPSASGGIILSDVMGRDRSINIFASLTRDIESISQRLDDSSQNSTILAPLNSAMEKLPRKPWEDARDYNTLGSNAYEGQDGQERAQRNLRRFVEAHVVPVSPWPEKEKVKSILQGDREVWWETRDGVRVVSLYGQANPTASLMNVRSSLVTSRLSACQVGSAMGKSGSCEVCVIMLEPLKPRSNLRRWMQF
jgi:hypothetical protein